MPTLNEQTIEAIAAKANLLRELHAGSLPLILPNAWDAASATVLQTAGFPAIATTSGGVAASLGYADHEGAPADEMLTAARRIVTAARVPVTVDFEAGYRLTAEDIVDRLIGIGAAGFNLEDSDHYDHQKLVDAESHAEKLAAIKSACRSRGVDLFLNARVDVFIQRVGEPEEQLAEGLRRATLP